MSTTPQLRPAFLDDAEALHAVIRACEREDDAPWVTPIEEVREDLEDPRFQAGKDAVVAWCGSEPVGYGWVLHRSADAKDHQSYLFGGVVPEHRRQGLGRQLLRWTEARGTELLQAPQDERPRFLRIPQTAAAVDAHQLYRRFGYQAVRYWNQMIRPLDEPVSVGPEVEGVRLIPWDDVWSEEVLHAHNDAFADHWGSHPNTVEEWELRLRRYGVRLDLSLIAIDVDGSVVGYSLVGVYPEDAELTGRNDAVIDTIGVPGRARRRGIATALLTNSLSLFADAGLTHGALGVDTDNPTGALGIYERAGFITTAQTITFQKAL